VILNCELVRFAPMNSNIATVYIVQSLSRNLRLDYINNDLIAVVYFIIVAHKFGKMF
jgi:hypothetical protein